MHRRLLLLPIAATTLLFASTVAHAQEPDAKTRKAAQELYEQAAQDMVAGEHARACARLEAAKKLLPGHIRTGMTLAECYRQAGQPASALAELLRVKALAEVQGKQEKIREAAKQLSDLEPHVPRMTLVIGEDVRALPGFSIVRNGTPVPVSEWGEAVPVDPGSYQLEATALGKERWATRVEVEAAGKQVTVKVEQPWTAPVRTTVEPTKSPEKKETVKAPRPLPRPHPTAPASSGLRTAGFVGMGFGVAGLGVGALLGGMTIARNGASDDGHCDAQNHCDQTGYDLRKEALALGNASTAAFAVGGALLATGVVLFAVSPSTKGREGSKDRTNVSMRIGPGGLGLQGVFQ